MERFFVRRVGKRCRHLVRDEELDRADVSDYAHLNLVRMLRSIAFPAGEADFPACPFVSEAVFADFHRNIIVGR